jgi:hypothetical protein
MKIPSEERISKQISKYIRKPEKIYYDCNCGALHKKDEFSICPKCGKKMCPSCIRLDGKHKGNYCWIPGRLKIQQNPWSDIYTVIDMETGEVSTVRFG